LEINLDNVNN